MQPSPRSTRRLAIPILLGGLLASCGGGDGPAGRGGAGRPGWSAVLVTLDTTRADHLGCYGHGGDLTPSLDALADEGSLFELCISSAAVTPVSHASILTGQHPYTHGLRVMFARSGFRLGEQCDTLPEILKEAGFRTGAFLSAYPVSEDFGLERGFDAFDWPGSGEEDQGMSLSEGGTTASWDVGQLQRRSDRTTDRAIAWIDEQASQSGHDLRAVDQRQPFLGRQRSRRQLRPGERFGSRDGLVIFEELTFADQHQRQMRQRRQIPARPDRPLRRNQWRDVAIEHLAQQFDQIRADAAVAFGQGVGPKHHHRAGGFGG